MKRCGDPLKRAEKEEERNKCKKQDGRRKIIS